MADVTIIPPAQVQTVAPAGSQTQQNPPQPSLPQGTLISGIIAGKDANGNFLLKSPQGVFTLQSSTPLTYNSDVTIRIGANAAGVTNARIVTVNGEPFAQFSQAPPAGSDSVSTTLRTPQVQPQPTLPANAVRAVVVSAPPVPANFAGAAFSAGDAVALQHSSPVSGTLQLSPQTDVTAKAPAASVSATATAAVQPQQVTQNSQVPVPARPVIAAPQPAAASPAGLPVSVAAQPVETQLAPVQAVTQSSLPQTPQAQNPQSSSLPPPAAPQPPAIPPAPVSALYNAYAKQPSVPAPATAAGQPAAPFAPALIPAQITTVARDGTVALQTPLGTVTVRADAVPALASLTPGASVTLQLLSTLAQAQTASLPAAISELAASWDSLKAIISLTHTANPQASHALLARLPQIGPGFLSSSASFISAMLQGNVRKLLGDATIDTLQRSGRQDLVEKFSAEAASLSSAFSTPEQRPVAGWQAFFLPFVYQEALQQARIYVKRDAPKKDRMSAKNKTADTRFVVEVELSELGSLQMDGLVRKKEEATAFDLIIRSHHAFSPEDQSALAAIYTQAGELTGFKGSLAFQVTRDFPVKPLEEMAGEETHGVTV